VYFDNQPCRVCGAEVELRAQDPAKPREGTDPDGPVDRRICTNQECPSNQGDQAGEAPRP